MDIEEQEEFKVVDVEQLKLEEIKLSIIVFLDFDEMEVEI